MKRVLKIVANTVVAVMIVLSVSYIYNFDIERNILGLKPFYNNQSRQLTVGYENKPTSGARAVLVQDEQATTGVLETLDDSTYIVSSNIYTEVEDGTVYSVVFSLHPLIPFMVIIGVLVMTGKKPKTIIEV